ncbi:MAG: T9SS type B sorting domain-containing protein, partial [Lutibacter sp.]|uniref:Ig-like domain-containing protein n=1 Tax=Lutibacter sp. TaxID=1925666 RepID=UPI0017D4DA0C
MSSINYKLFYASLVILLLSNYSWSQTPPTIAAIGNQNYCPLSEINIVTDFNIIPGSEQIEAVFIQISENYKQGEDILALIGSHPNVTTTWSASEGKLALSSLTTSTTTYLDLIDAVKDVTFYSNSVSISGEKYFSFTVDEANYLPSTDHYYEYVEDIGITWTAAKSAAEGKDYYGLQGYLATITSIEEAQLSGEQAAGAGWIGGSDATTEGVWKWVTGPENGMTFWNGSINGSSPAGVFSFWNNNEPNNLGNEDYAHITAPGVGITGSWNDLSNVGGSFGDYQPKGYIVEYGGMAGDPTLNISASSQISVSETEIINPQNGSNCGPGSVTLSATATLGGTVLWFDSLVGGSQLGSGTSFSTPAISASKTYYALASSDGFCDFGERVPVVATINNIPTITTVSPTEICNGGTANLTANASSGTINWYSNSTGGIPISSGSSFSPIVTTTTTYYVDATENGCSTTHRTSVTATVFQTNTPTTTNQNQTFCDIENKTLNDISISGTSILWYNAPSGGIPLDTNNKLTNNTIYYASQTLNGCESANRLAITITVFETVIPLLTSEIPPMNICDDADDGDDTNGFAEVDLTSTISILLNGKSNSNFTTTYFTDSGYVNKIDNPSTFTNTISGGQPIYVRMANNLDTNCFTDISFELKVNPLPILLNTEVLLEQCDDNLANDGFSFFNLNEANELISANYQHETFEFYADAAYTQLIADPFAYPNPTVVNSEVFVKISTINGCERFAKILLKVGATQIPASFHLDYYACEDTPSNNQDGRTFFDFSNAQQQLIDSKPVFSSQLVRISFFENLDDALAETNAIADVSNYKNSDPWEQKIYARIDSDDVNACLGLSHVITLRVEALPIANPVSINRQCDDDFDGFFPFDITTIESDLLNGQTNVTVSYFDENGNPLPSPLPNPFSINSQTITIRVTNNNTNVPSGACFDETTLEFIVDKKPVANLVPDLILCDDDFDGFIDFDTSTIQDAVLNGQTGMIVSYFDENGNTLPSPLPNPFFSESQTIRVLVENELNTTCVAENTFEIIVNPKPQFFLDQSAIYCLNLPPITVQTFDALDAYTYLWTDENNNSISNQFNAVISSAGNYSVIATSADGCTSFPQTIAIEASSIATITQNDITVVDDSENNSIAIDTTNLGIGDYEFSLKKADGFNSFFQDEPFFENLIPGIYTLSIRDKNKCGIQTIDISVIGFPKFFTPNNDGFNDTWKVLGVNEIFYPNSNIYIFDRFGKLITQINPEGNGWNGIFNGQQLPAT